MIEYVGKTNNYYPFKIYKVKNSLKNKVLT